VVTAHARADDVPHLFGAPRSPSEAENCSRRRWARLKDVEKSAHSSEVPGVESRFHRTSERLVGVDC
jgi:hypothetical protein